VLKHRQRFRGRGSKRKIEGEGAKKRKKERIRYLRRHNWENEKTAKVCGGSPGRRHVAKKIAKKKKQLEKAA